MAFRPTSLIEARPDAVEAAVRTVDAAGERSAAEIEPGIVHPAGRNDRDQDHDLESLRPDPAKIAARLRAGEPVLVAGEIKGADGKLHRGWIAVERYDEKTGTFHVHEPGAKGTLDWDAAKLTAFAGGKLGGEAIAIRQLPNPHASQTQIDELVKAAPAGMRANAATAVPLVLDACARAGVTDRKHIAYILASAQFESHLGDAMSERGEGIGNDGHDHYFDKYDGKMGNSHPHDGEKYKGRGYVQVTGHENYRRWSDRLDIDFVRHPERMTTPDIAAKAMVEGMRDGSFTSKGLGDYATAKRPYYDYEHARAIVNHDRTKVDDGATLNHGQIIAGYARKYEEALLRVQIREQLPRLAVDATTLPDPAHVTEWNGKPRTGTFVRLDDHTYALSSGRGQYLTFDLQKDLGGVAPPEGRPQTVGAKGHVHDPAPEHTPAHHR